MELRRYRGRTERRKEAKKNGKKKEIERKKRGHTRESKGEREQVARKKRGSDRGEGSYQ